MPDTSDAAMSEDDAGRICRKPAARRQAWRMNSATISAVMVTP
jgi:hypothetical protein